MSEKETFGVAIAGGGLAGLCLAIQLKQADPALSVLVVERLRSPMPHAAFKVGESSVEVGSHYFQKVLGLGDVLREELPKFGLRFFFSRGDNLDIASRLECGPEHFFSVPSFQIDRGQFENALAKRCRELGVELRFDCKVCDIRLGEGGDPHELIVDDGRSQRSVRARWLVDAAGRAALLKRKLGLARQNAHRANAAWFRMDCEIDVGDWSADADYAMRCQRPRRLSTNHLMGPGYWVWLIPLAGGRTSVGIVADDSLHPFDEINRFGKALGWIERHEPQLAARLKPELDRQLDFLACKDFSYGCRRVFSGDRWGVTGEAGVFLDPFYSPGSDFIGIGNGFLGDLILQNCRGRDIRTLAEEYDRTFRRLYRTMLTIYAGQYPIMGNARVMPLKIVWDFVMYWGGIALLHNHGKLCDRGFMERAQPVMAGFARLGFRMQRFLRRWHELDASRDDPPSGFVSYTALDFLARLNAALLEEASDEALLAQLEDNLALAVDLDRQIRARGIRVVPELAGSRGPVEFAGPGRLDRVFDVLWPAAQGG